MDSTQRTKLPAAEAIFALIDDIDDRHVGLRVVHETDVDVGDILPPSWVWVDGERTDEQLDGTSALCVTRARVDRIARVLADVACYDGTALVLVSGHSLYEGNDPGEIVIEDAEVLAVWTL